ncbi:MAG: hypothetical protein ACRCTI_16610 [Beijerinckiaceae bacterium]
MRRPSINLTTEYTQSKGELRFFAFVRDFTDKFFRLIAWMIYQSLIFAVYIKSQNIIFLILFGFGLLMIFLFLLSYMKTIEHYIIGRFQFNNRVLAYIPIIIISTAVTAATFYVTARAAIEIAQYGQLQQNRR